MSSTEIIKRLKKDGWTELPQGATSHKQFIHPTKKGKVTVPHPRKDFPPGTLSSILKQAGLK